MSTRHYVHNIITPGLSGDGIDDAEARQLRRQVSAVNVVSADWFSDLNAAITAAGVGGTVRLSKETTYDVADPLLYLTGMTIEGEDPLTTVVSCTGDAAMQVADTATGATNVTVRGITFAGNDTAGIGIDGRHLIRSTFDMIRVDGFTSHGSIWGGDGTSGGWTNSIFRSRIRAPLNGAAVRILGRASPTGSPTGINNTFIACEFPTRGSFTSFGVDVSHGDDNTFISCDVGYGVSSSAGFRFGLLGRRNRVLSCRTENLKRAVLIEGGDQNRFIMNTFGLYENDEFHGAEVYLGTGNIFRDNWWDAKGLAPRVWESGGPGSHQTLIEDLAVTYPHYSNTTMDTSGTMHSVNSASNVALGVRTASDARERFLILGDGRLSWRNPTSGAHAAGLELVDATNNVMDWTVNSRVRVVRSTSMPSPSADYRRVLLIREGASGVEDKMYVCLKSATDTYSWVLVANG